MPKIYLQNIEHIADSRDTPPLSKELEYIRNALVVTSTCPAGNLLNLPEVHPLHLCRLTAWQRLGRLSRLWVAQSRPSGRTR